MKKNVEKLLYQYVARLTDAERAQFDSAVSDLKRLKPKPAKESEHAKESRIAQAFGIMVAAERRGE